MIHCLVCGKLTELHQLDPELPDRLVGACTTCKSWALVQLLPGGSEALVAPLPDGVAHPGD
jgi:hypothetical protein